MKAKTKTNFTPYYIYEYTSSEKKVGRQCTIRHVLLLKNTAKSVDYNIDISPTMECIIPWRTSSTDKPCPKRNISLVRAASVVMS